MNIGRQINKHISYSLQYKLCTTTKISFQTIFPLQYRKFSEIVPMQQEFSEIVPMQSAPMQYKQIKRQSKRK